MGSPRAGAVRVFRARASALAYGKGNVFRALYADDVRCMVGAIMERRLLISAAALAALLAGAGCASSQMNRIDRNRDIYETWPIETRQAVLDGKVEAGMNADMVRVAWGEPTEITTSQAGDEIWIYSKGGDPGGVMYPGGSPFPGGPSYPGGGYPGGSTYPGGGIGGSGIGIGGTGIGMGGTGTGIGISTGRGGTSIGTSTGIGIGGGIGGGGIGGMGSPIMTRPTPPDIREVVFRNGTVVRADSPAK